MRYRFIVFRAQPKKDTIIFSIYLEEVGQQRIISSRSSSTLTSPIDELRSPPTSSSSAPMALTKNTTSHTVKNSRFSLTLDRNWDQCEWLQQKLIQSLRLQVLPPLPVKPDAKLLDNALYVERQRSQVERWLNRLGAREDICVNRSFDHFISTKMLSSEIGSIEKKTLSSKLLNLFNTAPDRGFRIYTPIAEIGDFDEDEEERRRDHILKLEECADEFIEALANMSAQQESFDKDIVKISKAIANSYNPKLISCEDASPQNAEERERLHVGLELIQNSVDSAYWNSREICTWKEFNLSDSVAEYRTMAGGFKEIMNNATQTLILYEKATMRYNSILERANNLRIQYPSDTPSVKYANDQEAQSERERELARQEYTDSCDIVKHELVRFEREKAHGMLKALENTAAVELEAARARHQELLAIRRRIKNRQLVKDPPHARTNIGPMIWHSSSPPLAPSSSKPMSALTVQTGTSATLSSSSSLVYPLTAPPLSNNAGFNFSDHILADAILHKKPSNSKIDHTAGSNGVFMVESGEVRSSSTLSASVDTNSKNNRNSSGNSGSGSGSSQLKASPFSDPIYSKRTSRSSLPSSPIGDISHWDGRTSTLPFQGYDPATDKGFRLTVQDNRLAEIEIEAEMEEELVRSGILTAKQMSQRKQHKMHMVGNAFGMKDTPPVLPAFRASTPLSHRHTSSEVSISTIPHPISPSAYLQYSRQTLSASLARPDLRRSMTTGFSPARMAINPRKDKNKARVYSPNIY